MNRQLVHSTGLLLVILSASAPPAAAQAVAVETSIILPANATEFVDFGRRVRAQGDRVVVGAPMKDGVALRSGEVQVFDVGAGTVLEGILAPLDLGANDRFGSAVALDGDVIAAGAYWHDGGGANAGAVYVFRWDGAAWNLEQKLQSPALQAGGEFGWAVDLEGDRLVVGERRADVGGAVDRGRFHVFEHSAGVWSPTFTDSGDTSQTNDWVGLSVAVRGDMLAVGSQESALQYQGSVYVYRWSGATWVQEQKIGPTLPSGQTFGHALALGDGLLCVGDPYGGAGGGGRVHIFRESASVWSEEAVLGVPYGSGLDLLGDDVSLSGDRLLAAAPGEYIWSDLSGAAHVFELQGSTWTSVQRLIPSTPTQFFDYASSVALVGSRAFVGVPTQLGPGQRVDVFELAPLVGTRFCAGDGTGTPCPCGNESDPALGNGCENKHGQGATLDGTGSASVAADDLSLSVTFTMSTQTFPPKGEAILLFAGDARINGGLGLPLGDGLRCVGGNVQRLGVRFGTPYRGIALWGPGLAAQLGVVAGDTRYFHAWYRDPIGSPCGSGFNTTNALELTFEP